MCIIIIFFNSASLNVQKYCLNNYFIVFVLQAIESVHTKNGNRKMTFKFVKYAQSSQCRSTHDSSVSYAAGTLVVH